MGCRHPRLIIPLIVAALLAVGCAGTTADSTPTSGNPTGDHEPVVPSGEGGLSGLFTTSASAEADVAGSASCAADAAVGSCDEPPEPGERFVPDDRHRLFCATLADFESREQPDFETATGRAVALSWLEELIGVASPDFQPTLRRFTDKLGELFELVGDRDVIDEDELPAGADRLLVSIAAEGASIERHIEAACFGILDSDIGDGDRSDPPPADPAVAEFCRTLEALDRQLAATEDPDEQVAVVLVFFEEVSASAPAEIRSEVALLAGWYRDAVEQFPAAELFGREEELAPAEVTEASEIVGLFADDACSF